MNNSNKDTGKMPVKLMGRMPMLRYEAELISNIPTTRMSVR
jgi:hypothetical protein